MNEQSEYWRGVHNFEARQAWASLLSSYPWDAFITSTDSDKHRRNHPLSILGRLRGSVYEISIPSRLFIAAEEFELGGWHGHGLVKWDVGNEALDIGRKNLELGRRLSKAGFSRVETAVSAVAVSTYLSKYVIKNAPWEWDIAGTGWGTIKT